MLIPLWEASKRNMIMAVSWWPSSLESKYSVDVETLQKAASAIQTAGSEYHQVILTDSLCSSSSAFPAISLRFTILLLCSQLYLWGSPFFFVCIPSYISGVHHSSSSVFPAISLGFSILLLLCTQLYLLGSPFFFFVPSYISGVDRLLRSQLYLWASPFFSEIFAYVTVSLSNHRGSFILSSLMVHAGCFWCRHSPI